MDKATKQEFAKVKKEFAKVNKKITGLKRSIGNCATKADLEAFATKADLEAFATKADLEAFATKADLEEGLHKFSQTALQYFVTRSEFKESEAKTEEKFVSKNFFESYVPLLENIWEAVKENQFEREVFYSRYGYLEDKVVDHDKRIKILEKKN